MNAFRPGSTGFVLFAAATTAAAQTYGMDWNTIDCGGVGPNGALAGGVFLVSCTVGQPDAGFMAGGQFEVVGGFWAVGAPEPCYANCDGSTLAPVLTANDFQCFLNAFAGGQAYANCDGSTLAPVLTANDFQCFLNAFATGCT